MPDNIKILAGTGDDTVAPPVATDLIGAQHYQRIKAGWGAEGTWAETADVDGVRLPVGGAQLGGLTETAPTTDTASSGLNGRLQRIAQRLTVVNTTAGLLLGEGTYSSLNGALTETAPGTDTASSGVNGRLQRIAQRLTSLIALLPTALGAGGGLKVDGSGTALPVSGTFWQATQPVSGTVTAIQGGTWTVQPGNTANTTAWKVDGSAVTQPISGTVTSNAGTNTSTAALGAATAVDLGAEASTDEAVTGAATGLRLMGFSARETTATAGAIFNLRHGTTASDPILVSVSLGVNESAREWFGPDGIAAANGIYLERVLTGTCQVIGYYKVVV